MEKRKHPRLKDYDYSQNGAYFITVCVEKRRPILSTVVGRGDHTPPQVELTACGRVLDKYIRGIEGAYKSVSVDKYVIMPNHFHLLISIAAPDNAHGGVWSPRPTAQTVLRSLKTMVTKEIGRPIFQTSFYDHIIRDENDYLTRWNYIDTNPARWAEDEYYAK